MMKWTDKQRETIESRDKNILVSAAAGSGKTAVLVERIKQLILQDKVDVDRFLITTFTKAAAAEMKERLEDAIRKSIEEKGTDRKFLERQLRLLPRANISTFHSFTIEVMRRYFYLTDLEPGVRIGDETKIEILKGESIDEVFDRRFAEDHERFSEFLTKYSSDRNEKRIKEGIVKLYVQMRSLPHYMEWAEEKTGLLTCDSPLEAYGLDAFFEEETSRLFGEAWSYYQEAVDLILDAGLEKLGQKASENLNLMRSIPRRIEEEGEFPDVKYEQLRAYGDEKEEYDLIKAPVKKYTEKAKKCIKDLRDAYYVFTLQECDDELKEQAGDTLYLVDILKEFERVFKAKKADENIVDFDDVMHYAIDILEDETAAAEYREKFIYIFVDEYQDCNQLQETIVEKISRGNNLFMVGDLKQSIYRFRLAEPELFRSRYERYRSGDQQTSIKIDLSNNFRSKRSVTDTVNAVFQQVMDGYDDDQKLICTAGDDHPGMTTSIHVIPKDAYTGDDEEFSDAEAALISDLIKDHLGREIYDTKTNTIKKVSYGDIVVLTRNNGTVSQLERYLNNSGIPSYGSARAGYYETVEIQVFINILKIISNTRNDVALISVMRSPAFDFEIGELAKIRSVFRTGSFYDAVKAYETEGSDAIIKGKITDMFRTIGRWKQLRTGVSLEELIKIVLDDTGYIEYCSGLPVAGQRIANLRLLVNKAAQFEETNYTGLYGFLRYVDAMKRGDIKQEEASTVGDGENVVRIMSIHRSKGLEFPIVILAGAGKKLNVSSDDIIPMHKDYSIALPHVNRDEGWHRKTLLQKAIAAKKRREAVEEEVRILYVALTRAKDKLIVTGTVEKEDSLDENFVGYTNYLQMMYAPLCGTDVDIVMETDAPDADEVSETRGEVAALLRDSQKARDEEKIRQIDEKLSWEYPHSRSEVRSKYSVSQLNSHEGSSMPLHLARGLFSDAPGTLDAAQVGTAMHAVMERLDFGRALTEGRGYIEAAAEEMHTAGLLTDSEMEAISIDDLNGFFETEVGRRAAKAPVLHKEQEFIMSKEIDGQETVVQGIIDCFFEEEDGLVLIDYKNSYIGENQTPDVIAARYEDQISLYKEALEAATGKVVKESYLYLFQPKKFLKMN